MRNHAPDPRRRKMQMIASAVVAVILALSLVLRDNADLGQGQFVFGWIMVAALALYAGLSFWRRGE